MVRPLQSRDKGVTGRNKKAGPEQCRIQPVREQGLGGRHFNCFRKVAGQSGLGLPAQGQAALQISQGG